jgi:hypothetical protein
MLIQLENGNFVRGDLVHQLIVRSDCTPVPMHVEAVIRVDSSIDKDLTEGNTFLIGNNKFRIIKREIQQQRLSVANHGMDFISIIAVIDCCAELIFVKKNAVIRYNATMTDVYRACGAKINNTTNDLTIDKFVCLAGNAPTYAIARSLQNQSAIVRYKNGSLDFFRINGLFKQNPITTLPVQGRYVIDSEFMLRHLVPTFVSSDADGNEVTGNTDKVRAIRYEPFKNEMQLRNLSKCLILDSKVRMFLANKISGGDLVALQDSKQKLVVVTAAHVLTQDSQYTDLFLYKMVA